jgi:hypothetical protein
MMITIIFLYNIKMDRIMNYVDDLMMNYPLETEQSYTPTSPTNSTNPDDIIQGGKFDEQKGFGGFPPIYVCTKGETKDETPFEEEETKPKREYSKPNTAVSIVNIMEERRKVTPFIIIGP